MLNLVTQQNTEIMSEEKNLEDNLKEKAKEFAEEAKESASEFAQNAKETFTDSNKKIVAGVIAIFLGGLGIHKFVLGYTKEGLIILMITIILGVLTCGVAGWLMSVLGLIEGIVYLTKTDEEFYNTYQAGKKPWF